MTGGLPSPSTGRQRSFDARKSDRRGDIVGLDLGLSFAGVAAYVYWVGGIGVVWYAVEYRVPTDKVYIDPKPTDCDFWRAPLGYKGCHYEDWFSLNTQRGAVEQTLPKRVSRPTCKTMKKVRTSKPVNYGTPEFRIIEGLVGAANQRRLHRACLAVITREGGLPSGWAITKIIRNSSCFKEFCS